MYDGMRSKRIKECALRICTQEGIMRRKVLQVSCGFMLFLSVSILIGGFLTGKGSVSAAENAFQEVPFKANFYFDNRDYQGEEGKERLTQAALDNLVRIEAKTGGEVTQNKFILSSKEKELGLHDVGSTCYSSKVEFRIQQNLSGGGTILGKDDQNHDVKLSQDTYSFVKTHANAQYSPQKGAKVGLGWLVVSMRPYYEGTYGDWSDVCVKQSVFGDRNGISGRDLTFEADGEYCIQLYFEALYTFMGIACRTYNVKLEYHFKIFNDHVDVKMYGSENGVERNSVTNRPFRIEKTQTRYAGVDRNAYQNVTYTRYGLNGEYRSEGCAYNADASEYFTEDGYYMFRYRLGDCFSRSFSITLDRSEINARLRCYNIYGQEGDTKYAERYFELAWQDAYLYGEKLRADIYRDGTLIEHARTDGKVKRYEGAGLYRIVVSNITNTTGDRSSKTLDFYVRVEADSNPVENYDRLNNQENLNFNRLQSKWLQVENPNYGAASGGEIYRHRYVCFPIGAAKQAHDFANTIGSSVKTSYYTPKLTGDFFFVSDKSIAVDAPITQELYLYDTFKYLHGKQNAEGGYIESAYGTFVNEERGNAQPVQYGIPVSAYLHADGKYRVTEYDMYGNSSVYYATRDLTAPVVRFTDEAGGSYTAVNGGSYQVGEFSVSDFYDVHDDWAVLRVNGKYYLKNEILGQSFLKSGFYAVDAYDRNDNVISFTIEVKSRDLSLNVLTHNDAFVSENGGTYTLLYYHAVLKGEEVLPYCSFTINGKEVGYEAFSATETAFGVYMLQVSDRYNETAFTITVTIAPREIRAFVASERAVEDVRQNDIYFAKQFQIVLPEDYYDLSVNGKTYRGDMDALCLPGAYRITVSDRYSLQQIQFQVVIAEREKDFYLLENNSRLVAAGDGAISRLYSFSLNYADQDVLTNCDVYLNGNVFDAFGERFTDFGTYTFEIRDKFDGSKIIFTAIVEAREPKSQIVYDFDHAESAQDGREYTVRRFRIAEVPAYCAVTVNGKPASADYITAHGTYEVVVSDRYNAAYQKYVLRIGDLVTIDGAQNATRTDASVKLFFDADTVKITLRIDGKLSINFGGFKAADGYAYLNFDVLQSSRTHIYVVAENMFDANDRQEIFLILEKSELSPKSQISGDAQTSGAVRSDAARGDSRTSVWIGGAAIACAAGVVCAGIAYRNRRKHNG